MADREGAIVVSETVQSGETSGPQVTVVVHPLVLLSTVDHYNRVAMNTKKRVVGVLLGTRSKGSVDVTNSFAVPFEEDRRAFRRPRRPRSRRARARAFSSRVELCARAPVS